MGSDHGERQNFLLPQKILPTCFIMSLPHNINAETFAPVVVNPESIPVDSDPEEDLEEIQREVVAEQRQIEEMAQAKLAAAHECIEKKRKVKEKEARKAEEVRKVEEEEGWKWKEEEDQVAREKALDESWKWQLKVSCYLPSLYSRN